MSTKILFVCTQNSARSQIAEGLINHDFENFLASSAGTRKTRVHPFAIQVMKEINIDISHHKSKTIEAFMGDNFDYIITVCDKAKELCPYFPSAKTYLHTSFFDPSTVYGSKQEKIQAFRDVRNLINKWLINTLKC